ncbi:hypothetical protein CR513_55706, partial [Mucuna pruriens]
MLKGVAMRWFSGLAPHSITSFLDLATAFESQFAANKTKHLEKGLWVGPSVAAKYVLILGQLYKQGFSFPLLRCLGEVVAKQAIKEIHEGACESHISGRALANKIACAGFYWSILKRDSLAFVKKSISSGTRASQVPHGGSGLFHQMDQGGASSQNLN